MSNNKQIMKLYTEEQVIDMLSGFIGKGNADDYLIRYYTPIELPSDEEIEQEAERMYPLTGDISIDHRNHLRKKGFIDGMEWMRDKIQGGNNEQQ